MRVEAGIDMRARDKRTEGGLIWRGLRDGPRHCKMRREMRVIAIQKVGVGGDYGMRFRRRRVVVGDR